MQATLCDIRDLVTIASVLLFGAGLTLASALGPAPSAAGRPVLVVAPPWGPGAPAIVALAGGRILGPVEAPFGVLAVFDDPRPAERLLALGAWTACDARAMASLCGVNE
ncbi:hypothetical protein [Salipiger mucosus]|uniref:Uncharacterized protein n=1 Tax=Salipiger mucosus DSM 16094 TaxID=1123237 RepID=S9RK40_9RHOB|nr:hypothetical protein [Salipiger mucosus]EPX78480.1 hypothetical protein Salmuc_03590 [Salipiger mucosus DSM 16094]